MICRSRFQLLVRRHLVQVTIALNGTTIGTLDGANVEIQEEVGANNIFIFGQTVEGIEKLHTQGYNPRSYYENDAELKAVLDWLYSDYFCPGEGALLKDLPDSLLQWGDPFFVLADCRAYIEEQERVSQTLVILNMGIYGGAKLAGSGKFSSDRTIQEYASIYGTQHL